jgi:hypothetical protein
MEEEYLHLARLSIDDLEELALSWRIRSLRGDATTAAIAEALESVVRSRRAAAYARDRVLAMRRALGALAPLRRAAEWAVSRR